MTMAAWRERAPECGAPRRALCALTILACLLPRALTILACLLAIGLATLGGDPAEARPGPPPSGPKVRVELISELAGIVPGGQVWVGLRQQIAPGWHTYWTNPGDSGEPATIEWTLPDGFEASDIIWPHPERIPVGPVMSFGYSGQVVLLVRISAPDGVVPGSRARLRGQVSWLVCEKICIPEEARVELTLPVVAATPPADPRGAPLIAAARRGVPTPSPWPASFSATPDEINLAVAARGLSPDRIAD